VAAALALALPSCADRFSKFTIGRPTAPGTLSSRPTALADSPPSFGGYRVCPAEAVTLSWELRPSASRDECVCLNGAARTAARGAPIACTSDDGCAAGERCIDARCCGRDCRGCGFPEEICPSAFEARLTADGVPAIPITSVTGSAVVRPLRDTTYTLTGEELSRTGARTGRRLPEQTIVIDVLEPGAVEPYTLGFAWECPHCAWRPSFLPHREDELVQLVSVRNTGPYTPAVAGVDRALRPPPPDIVGPVAVTRIPTEAFNGHFGGTWSIGLSDETASGQCAADLSRLAPVRCEDGALEGFAGRRLPDFALTMEARCRPAKP
jgi:hypothetical protein